MFKKQKQIQIERGIGDGGLGIGDWANPQSPIPNPQNIIYNLMLNLTFYKNFNINYD